MCLHPMGDSGHRQALCYIMKATSFHFEATTPNFEATSFNKESLNKIKSLVRPCSSKEELQGEILLSW